MLVKYLQRIFFHVLRFKGFLDIMFIIQLCFVAVCYIFALAQGFIYFEWL